MASEQLKIVIDADYKGKGEVNQASRGLDDLDKSAKKTSSGMEKLTGTVKANKAAILGAAGVVAAGGAALVKFGKESVEAANIQENAEKQLAQTLESTGHAAGLTAQELKNMAGALQSVTTFGDEAIIGAQSLLLTFTNIGGQVMPDATETVLNMSQALGQDLKSSAVQLGKALNDPILGVSALSRVGVSFTQEQKNTIKTMVEMNDVAGAQGIILAELNKEFGGQAQAAAETYAGKMQQVTNEFGDFQEVVGRSIQQNEGFVDSLAKVTTGLLTQATGWEVIEKGMKEGFITGNEVEQMFIDGQAAGKGQNDVLQDIIAAYNEWVVAQEKAIITTESHDKALIGATTAMEGLGEAATNLSLSSLTGDFGDLSTAEDRLAFMAAMARDTHVEAGEAFFNAGVAARGLADAADDATESIDEVSRATIAMRLANEKAAEKQKFTSTKLGETRERAKEATKRIIALKTALDELPQQKTIEIITNFIGGGGGPNVVVPIDVPANNSGNAGGGGEQERVISAGNTINVNVSGGNNPGQAGQMIAGRIMDIMGGLN